MSPRPADAVIEESFPDKPATLFVGGACLTYYVLRFVGDQKWMIAILPPFPGAWFIALAGFLLGAQILAWIKLKQFRPGWFLKPRAWLLFFSEALILNFAAGFVFWPVYGLLRFMGYLSPAAAT